MATVENWVRARPAARFPRLEGSGSDRCLGCGDSRNRRCGQRKASEISELRRTAKWRDPLEEIEEEDDLLTGEELKLFQSVAARFHFLAMDKPDLMYSVKELMREMASPRTRDLIALKRVARYTIEHPRMACKYLTLLDSNIEYFGDANFAGCISTRKSTVGGVALWSGQFVKTWSKTMGVLALSCGESELAAVVRAATEGLGLQSILSDIDLCGHVAIKSDATAAKGMVRRLGSGKVRHLAVGDLWVQHHVRSGKFRVSKMSGLEKPNDAAVNLGQDNDQNLRFVKNHFWSSLKKLFKDIEKFIKDHNETTGVSMIDYGDYTRSATSLLCNRIHQISNAKTYVFADSVLCLGGIKENPNEDWKEKMKWYFENNHLKDY